MVIEQLALQFASAKWTTLIPQIELPNFVHSMKGLLVQVWPPEKFNEVEWPPPVNFDDADNRIRYLEERLG
jgi:hypothetical protein